MKSPTAGLSLSAFEPPQIPLFTALSDTFDVPYFTVQDVRHIDGQGARQFGLQLAVDALNSLLAVLHQSVALILSSLLGR